MKSAERGATLIVVLGVLLILSLLATTFASLQQVERDVSRNYLDDSRAKLVAMSGVEDALSRMRHLLERDPAGLTSRAWRYFGDDTAETGDPALAATPLELAKNPSFAVEDESPQDPNDANVQPKWIVLEGRPVGASAFLEGGTYGRHADVYSLHVRDLQGLIHVNDGERHGPQGSVSRNLRRILDNLGAQLGVGELGETIVTRRPPGGYTSPEQLVAVLGRSDFGKVGRFLTLHAWVDRDVANPVPFSAAALGSYPVGVYRGNGVFRFGRNRNAYGGTFTAPLAFTPPAANGVENAVYGMDELNPQWIEIVERAPVNVNTAPREVLLALLDGLRGVFLVERRRDSVPGWQSAYQWLGTMHSYDSQGAGGDEIGFLYETVPLVGPGSAGAAGIDAGAVADHLIACRERRATPAGVLSSFSYSTVPWGGPFRSWRQFAQFCDNLAAIGLLVDNRNLYFDVDPSGVAVSSELQKRKAAQAIADVLKANFNPNLHLNETNPDNNLFTWVDKTDLTVLSTEFCFQPMGFFGIDSVGRVLRPVGSDDAQTASDNRRIAEKRVRTIVKLYDVRRETHQRHFYPGEIPEIYGGIATNNHRTLEIGPEPDQGVVAPENPPTHEWDGVLTLPTIGGVDESQARNATTSTPPGVAEFGSVLHGHFSRDTLLHHHLDGTREEAASRDLPGEAVSNLPDGTEGSTAGPYDPTGRGGNYYRLARSFRIDPGTTPPVLTPRAPLDLRIDGAYSERHSAPAYLLSPKVFGSGIGAAQGVMALWLKPSFFPEMSGKPRMLVSADRYHDGTVTYVNPSPFMLLYSPSHDAAPYRISATENTIPYYDLGAAFGVQPFRPMSLGFGYGFSSTSGYGSGTLAEGGCLTSSLNHLTHPDANVQPSLLQGHRWTHVILTWRVSNPDDTMIYVNGTPMLGGTTRVWYPTYAPNSSVDWTVHAAPDGTRNTLRLGAVSRYRSVADWGYARNWPADATLDELYLWNSISSLPSAFGVWQLGRYRFPTSAGEAIFTSAPIDALSGVRSLPPSSGETPPPGSSFGAGAPGGTTSMNGPTVRILAVSWTWFAEEADPSGEEVLTDHVSGTKLHPRVKVSILEGGAVHGPYDDARFSLVTEVGGSAVDVSGPFRYRVEFTIPDAAMDSILLSTPVFDDITIFYRMPGSEFLSYSID